LSRIDYRSAGLRLASIAVVLAAWEIAGRAPVSIAFPTFTDTLAAAIEMIRNGSLIRALGITIGPMIIGVALSATIGVLLGLATGLSRGVEWVGIPLFLVLQAAPLAALIPMLVLAYGVGLASKVGVVCIMAVPVIVLNSYKAVRHTPASLLEMGRSFLGSRRQLIQKVILPSASPVIFAGLRLGTAAGFVGAILAELLISPTGVGDLISYHQSIAEYPQMYAAIASVIIMSALFLAFLDRIEIILFRPEKRTA
jgi:ABC-type nitrate/sulfonate/bicarbonate transport system permease component